MTAGFHTSLQVPSPVALVVLVDLVTVPGIIPASVRLNTPDNVSRPDGRAHNLPIGK